VGNTAEPAVARRLSRLVVLLAGLVIATAAATASLFVWPESEQAEPSDALVVLGPGLEGERLIRARELAGRKLTSVVVVSRSRQSVRWPIERELCALPHAICFRARPSTTRGEARMVGNLARTLGWRSLLIVTSTYHVTRVRILFSRCFDGLIRIVAADPPGGLRALGRAMLHEWGGLGEALLRRRAC
jgi:uncharacterized SAM-binding protein YcdF (DUF218 family)